MSELVGGSIHSSLSLEEGGRWLRVRIGTHAIENAPIRLRIKHGCLFFYGDTIGFVVGRDVVSGAAT